ncbi:MAG: glycoside hydrolase family 95 protein, partial [Clostridia bacterium]
EEMPESEVTHRHISHLYGLHPAQLITPQETPALAEACKKSHLLRTDDGTGWSLGWKINHWARLLDGNHAFQLIERQLRPVFTSDILYQSTQGGGTYPNLLDAHPPFQIDGNFGACAGIAEMLLQSRKGELFLLPALPDAWQSGYVSGLRARDGLTVELAWTQGQITQAYVTADYATTCRVDRKTFSLEAGVKTRIR